MIFQESNLSFDFNEEHWTHLLKFDETKEFELAQTSISGTKGVDFSAVYKSGALVLIEVKNFRGYRIENKPRLIGGEDPLWLEVARKMRDATAIILGTAKSSIEPTSAWIAYFDVLKNKKKQLHLVLWLEQDTPTTQQQRYRQVQEDEAFRRQLKRSLKWLTNKVDVVDKTAYPFADTLSVSFL